MKKLLILLFFCSIQIGYAQNYQTVEDVDKVCSQLGFASDEDAQLAVDRILNEIGLPSKGFSLRNCPNINNAVAKNIKDDSGKYHRYILYDINFMKRISENSNDDWSAISILAHEIGHHLSGHSLNNEGSNHTFELEADYWSGWALAKLGASLQEAQSAINSLRYEKATSTHPAKKDRLLEIERGWSKGTINSNEDVNNPNNEKVIVKKKDKDEEIQKRIKVFNARETYRNNDLKYRTKDSYWNYPKSHLAYYIGQNVNDPKSFSQEFVDKNGETVVDFKNRYQMVDQLYEGLAWVLSDGKFGYVDEKGVEVIPLNIDYKSVGRFSEGMAWVESRDNSLKGFINTKGELIIPMKYRKVQHFNEGLAPVVIGEGDKARWGYINTKGEIVIEPLYKIAYNFVNGLAQVSTNKKFGFINKKGEMVIPEIYKTIYGYFNEEGSLFVIKSGRSGFWINKKGEKLKQ